MSYTELEWTMALRRVWVHKIMYWPNVQGIQDVRAGVDDESDKGFLELEGKG